MTEETKKLFDAPWRAIEHDYDNWFSIIDSVGFELARDIPYKEDANRIALLPELYDALMEAAVKYCPDAFFANDECRLCPDKKCIGRKWIELLRKVRDRK